MNNRTSTHSNSIRELTDLETRSVSGGTSKEEFIRLYIVESEKPLPPTPRPKRPPGTSENNIEG